MPGIRDRSVAWKTKRRWFGIREFSGLDVTGASALLQSLSEGSPTVEPLTTSESAGLPMTTADEASHVFTIPWDLRRDMKVLARLVFQHASADADSPQFTFTSKFFERGEAMTEFVAGADASVAFPAHLCDTNNPSLEATNWADLEWDKYLTADDILAAISIELNALGGATGDECALMGFELMYEIEATDERRRRTAHEVNRQPA